MSIIGSNVLAGASGAGAAGYAIERSLRFNSGDSAYLSKQYTTSGNRRKATISMWLKRGNLANNSGLFLVSDNATSTFSYDFDTDDTIRLYFNNGAANLNTSAVFRDASAWYHLTLVIDTANATSSDRIKIYVNGVNQTLTGTFPSQNSDTELGLTGSWVHTIGRHIGGSEQLDGSLADVHFIDSQALSASDFGGLDSNNVWQAKEYAGTYSTNGFHLDFSDNSSDAALGTDTSGNGNTWTVNNLTAAGNSNIYTYAVTTTEGGGAFYSGTGANLFSASTLLYGGYNTSAPYDSNIVWTPPGGVSVNNPKITLSYYSAVKINGTVYTPTGSGELTIPFVGTLNTLVLENTDGSGAVVRAYGLKPDGTNLVTIIDSAGTDALRDSPSQIAGQTDTGVGNEVIGNYATLNPIMTQGTAPTVTNGNLDAVGTSQGRVTGTFGLTSGKWYFEVTRTTYSDIGNHMAFGVMDASSSLATTAYGGNPTSSGGNAQEWVLTDRATAVNNSTYTNLNSTLGNVVAGDVVQICVDMDNKKIWFGKNNTFSGVPASATGEAFSNLPATVLPLFYTDYTGLSFNGGQRAFAYTAPSGYKALCVSNLPDPTIADGSTAMNVATWTGSGAARNITGLNHRTGLAWVKYRSGNLGSGAHYLFDSNRGANKYMSSNSAGAEDGSYTDLVTGFLSDGFSLGADAGSGGVNYSASGYTNEKYVGWSWAGGANSNKTYAITVSNPGSGNKFYADGALQPTLTLAEGSIYRFDQSSGTNSTHPLRFSTTSDGTHGGGSEYTTGVTTSGTPGSAGAYTQIVIAASAPTLYAYCTAHSGMGFQINTSDTAGYTIPAGGLNSSLYDQSQTWSNSYTDPGGWYDAASNATKTFDGSTSSMSSSSATGATATFSLSTGISYSARVEVNTNFSGTLTFNGSGSISANNNGWTTLATGSGTFSAFTATADSGQRVNTRAVRVDGILLVDSGATPPNVPSIASRVQANPSAGFSIVNYLTNGTSGATVGHGIAAPHMIITKSRDDGTRGWAVYHRSVSVSGDYTLVLNSTAAKQGPDDLFTGVSSTTFTLGNDPWTNWSTTQNMIAYCFAPVEGYSAFGSYEGLGTTGGAFVYLGFRPALLIVKDIDGTWDWYMYDTARNTYNVVNNVLKPSSINIEEGHATNNTFDFLSNGFKVKGATSQSEPTNYSGHTYVYYAAAEHPFKSSRAR